MSHECDKSHECGNGFPTSTTTGLTFSGYIKAAKTPQTIASRPSGCWVAGNMGSRKRPSLACARDWSQVRSPVQKTLLS